MRLSYTMLKTYLECPLRYKLRYLCRLPTRPRGHLRFGRVIYSALARFHSQLGTGDSGLGTRNEDLGWERLETCYELAWGQDLDPQPRARRQRAEGLEILWQYHRDNRGAWPRVVETERKLTASLGMHLLVAKVDRVDLLPDGCCEIVDYKLDQEALSPEEAEEDLQLRFYLAVFSQARNLSAVCATFYFLRQRERLRVRRGSLELWQEAQSLRECADSIACAAHFAPRTAQGCCWCDYSAYCPAKSEYPISAEVLPRQSVLALL